MRILKSLLIILITLINPTYLKLGSIMQIQYCARLRCELCSDEKLICKTGMMKVFPYEDIKANYYESVEVAYQTFTETSLYVDLFMNLLKVKELSFTYTNLRLIEGFTFQKLEQLKSIRLNNNLLGEIADYAFFGLDLNTLYLDDNLRLELKDRSFDGLKVQVLSLSKCNLNAIKFQTFRPLFPSLKVLTLAFNSIHHISDEFEMPFSQFRHLEILSLGHNPFECDCDNLWLIKLLTLRYVNRVQNPLIPAFESLYPNCNNLKNNSMIYVNPKMLGCYGPRIDSLTIALGSGCQALLTCKSNKPGSLIRWYRVHNSERQVLNRSEFKILHYKDSNKSSSVYLSRIQSENETFQCEVDGAISSAEIKIGRLSCYDAASIEISNFILIVYFIMVIIIVISTVTFAIYAIHVYCRSREVRSPSSLPQFISEDIYAASRSLRPPTPPMRSDLLQPIAYLPWLVPPMTSAPSLPDICSLNEKVLYDYPRHIDFSPIQI